jgi:hypothetical protein
MSRFLSDLRSFHHQFDYEKLDSLRLCPVDFKAFIAALMDSGQRVLSDSTREDYHVMFRGTPVVIDDSLSAGTFAVRLKTESEK